VGQWRVAGEANELLSVSLTAPTLRNASQQMGEQLLQLAGVWHWANEAVAALGDAGPGPWHHAVVFAALAAAAGATPVEALRVYLHQAALGVLGAGVRAIPIGHTHGQQIMARLHPLLERLADDLSGRDLETAGAGCPAYEILCHEQSRLYSRLFRS
jgi:urease accessory protein